MNRDLFGEQQELLEVHDEDEGCTPQNSTSFVEQMEALDLSAISAHSITSHEEKKFHTNQHANLTIGTDLHIDASPNNTERATSSKSPEDTPEPIATANSISPAEATLIKEFPTKSLSIPPLQMGDHVYRRCTFALIPFQHHAIVLDIWKIPEEDGDECVWMIKVFDFSRHPEDVQAIPPDSPRVILSSPQKKRKDGLRVYESPAQHWQKVIYGAPVQRHLFSSSGTCTAAKSDAPGLIRARVQFLIEHATDEIVDASHEGSPTALLPEYAWFYANSECVAVWCKTGTWATMQAVSWLTWTALGQIKSAATIAGVAAATQVAVPAAGLWGWLGYTAQASLLTVQPALAPAIAAYGAVTVAVPAVWWHRARNQWQSITVRLNEAFWKAAIDDPDLFADGMTLWSE
ncbi:hypothetical protein FisN_25Lh222 [Fistulifera solaris]|uniref:Uncharacterized protein n=1 Tax=Fistulifera solaris TaxID=1519565 RepID=A0A1Z5KQZ3_FISSO|nr:hypothetical protein FisN_25Lh222 [Fistulifera solaris]|eukprot:GAX28726.1 hypothetical protein FisN_25Lh222 [Fistulifera solaris]